MTTQEAGKLAHDAERERILAKARELPGGANDPRLYPPLTLSRKDQI